VGLRAAGLSFPVFHAEPLPGTTIDVQLCRRAGQRAARAGGERNLKRRRR